MRQAVSEFINESKYPDKLIPSNDPNSTVGIRKVHYASRKWKAAYYGLTGVNFIAMIPEILFFFFSWDAMKYTLEIITPALTGHIVTPEELDMVMAAAAVLLMGDFVGNIAAVVPWKDAQGTLKLHRDDKELYWIEDGFDFDSICKTLQEKSTTVDSSISIEELKSLFEYDEKDGKSYILEAIKARLNQIKKPHEDEQEKLHKEPTKNPYKIAEMKAKIYPIDEMIKDLQKFIDAIGGTVDIYGEHKMIKDIQKFIDTVGGTFGIYGEHKTLYISPSHNQLFSSIQETFKSKEIKNGNDLNFIQKIFTFFPFIISSYFGAGAEVKPAYKVINHWGGDRGARIPAHATLELLGVVYYGMLSWDKFKKGMRLLSPPNTGKSAVARLWNADKWAFGSQLYKVGVNIIVDTFAFFYIAHEYAGKGGPWNQDGVPAIEWLVNYTAIIVAIRGGLRVLFRQTEAQFAVDTDYNLPYKYTDEFGMEQDDGVSVELTKITGQERKEHWQQLGLGGKMYELALPLIEDAVWFTAIFVSIYSVLNNVTDNFPIKATSASTLALLGSGFGVLLTKGLFNSIPWGPSKYLSEKIGTVSDITNIKRELNKSIAEKTALDTFNLKISQNKPNRSDAKLSDYSKFIKILAMVTTGWMNFFGRSPQLVTFGLTKSVNRSEAFDNFICNTSNSTQMYKMPAWAPISDAEENPPLPGVAATGVVTFILLIGFIRAMNFYQFFIDNITDGYTEWPKGVKELIYSIGGCLFGSCRRQDGYGEVGDGDSSDSSMGYNYDSEGDTQLEIIRKDSVMLSPRGDSSDSDNAGDHYYDESSSFGV